MKRGTAIVILVLTMLLASACAPGRKGRGGDASIPPLPSGLPESVKGTNQLGSIRFSTLTSEEALRLRECLKNGSFPETLRPPTDAWVNGVRKCMRDSGISDSAAQIGFASPERIEFANRLTKGVAECLKAKGYSIHDVETDGIYSWSSDVTIPEQVVEKCSASIASSPGFGTLPGL